MRLLILCLFLVSCASKQQVLSSNFSTVKNSKTGILLTIDLKTGGKIKRGKSCKLYLTKDNRKFAIPLKEGAFNYALPLDSGNAKFEELNCGPFYYYKLSEFGTGFTVKTGEITYLGTLDFELEGKGEMIWGPNTKSARLLEGHLGEMGLTSEDVVIRPLNL